MHKSFLVLGALLGALAVGLGAFGAHGLKGVVSPESIAIFQTGVQYQMYHSLALLIAGSVSDRLQSEWIKWAGNFFAFGILLFSGSLYLITALTASGKPVPTTVGVLTPAGGLCFIAGWLFLLTGVLKKL